MTNSSDDYSLSLRFDSKDYIEATNDAASRTRTVTIVLVVTSVLIGIGWYNSLQWSWQRHRLKQAYFATDEALCRILDCDAHPELKEKEYAPRQLLLNITNEHGGNGGQVLIKEEGKSPVGKYRDRVREDTVKGFIENVRFIKAPFFGIAFDVNDLGVIGGVALIMILLVMRYSLSREIKNLNVSLREAVYHEQLPGFYHAVAMRQVFTVPHMKGEIRNEWLALAPRAICILPVFIFSLGVLYDFYSTLHFGVYPLGDVSFTLIVETLWLGLIVYLAARCWERQSHIDEVWEDHWRRLIGLRSSVIRLKNDLAEEFGSDEIVDRALRGFPLEAWEANERSDNDEVWDESSSSPSGLKSAVIRLKKDLVQEFGRDEDVDRELRRLRAEA